MKLKKYKIIVLLRIEEQEENEIHKFVKKLHKTIREELDFSGLVTIEYEND